MSARSLSTMMGMRVFFTVNVNCVWLIQLAAAAALATADFDAKFVESALFVDKSELLQIFFTRNMASHELFTCPPGFGKTTNLKMIEKFSEIELDEKGTSAKAYNDTVAYHLFAGLKISRYSRIINEHCAQHPVIFLDLHFSFGTFGSQISQSRSEIRKAFSRVLRKSFAKYKIALDEHFAKNSLKREPVALLASKIINDDLNETEIGSALFLLSRELFRCFDKKVVLLIDGFDHVVNEALTLTGMATATGDTRHTVDYYYKLLDDMLRSALALDGDNARCMYIYDLTVAVTSLAYRHDRFAKYMVHRRYTEYDPIIEYFGLLDDELSELFDKFAPRNETEKQSVEKYYSGYRTVDQQDLRYNTRQITRYLERRRRRSSSSTSTSCSRSRPTDGGGAAASNSNSNVREGLRVYGKAAQKTTVTSVWRFLKNPEYLDKVSKLIKHCPFRKKFKTKYAYDHYDIYLDLIESDFKNTSFGDAQILYTYCIEYGIFTPIDVTTYAIANPATRNSLIANLRYYFAVELNIDLKLVRFLLHRILHHNQEHLDPQPNFREILQHTFDRIPKFDPREYLCDLEFVLQSVLHVAASTSQRLTVDEEYPAIMASLPRQHTSKQSQQETRCVTLVKSGHSAVIIKITLRQSAEQALQNALAYSYSDQRIRYLKYLAIDVDSNNTVSLIISDENGKTNLLPAST